MRMLVRRKEKFLRDRAYGVVDKDRVANAAVS